MPYFVTGREQSTGQAVAPFYVEAASEAEARALAAARGVLVDTLVFVPTLKRIGYWITGEEPPVYPDPNRLISPDWRRADRARIVAYLRAGQVCGGELGFSFCRVCGARNGAAELSDGEWVWPEGLAHYIEAHGVRLPEAVVESMERRGWQVLAGPVLMHAMQCDDSFWITWASEARQWAAEPDVARDRPRD